jgi:hypothetical protein
MKVDRKSEKMGCIAGKLDCIAGTMRVGRKQEKLVCKARADRSAQVGNRLEKQAEASLGWKRKGLMAYRPTMKPRKVK